MFTKLVVTVASTTSSAAHQPTPAAASIVPGIVAAGDARQVPADRHQPQRGQREAGKHRGGAGARRARVARVVGKHQQPRHLVANHDVDAPQQGRRRLRRWRCRRRGRQREGRPRQHRAGNHHQRHGNAIGMAHRARTARDDHRGQHAEHGRPDPRADFAAQQLRAHRGGNRVVDGNPREVGQVEQSRHELGAAQAERRPRRDHRRHAEARADRRQQRDEQRAKQRARHHQHDRVGAAVAGAEHRAGLQRGGDDVGGGKDQEQVKGRLRALRLGNGREVRSVHGGAAVYSRGMHRSRNPYASALEIPVTLAAKVGRQQTGSCV